MRHLMSFVFAVIILPSLDCKIEGQNLLNSRLNFFDIDLLKYAAEDHSGNVMISPASIKSTLAMLLEGADGETAAEIRSALRLSPDKDEYREQLNQYLTAISANTANTTLQNANAVFVSDKYTLKNDYDLFLQKVYLAKVFKINYGQPLKAANEINGWISEKTKGLIPNIVDPTNITPSIAMMVTNALYFKSSWRFAFNPRQTKRACFYKNGICRNVAMMELQAELNYAYVDNLRSHALELPYQGGKYSMVLIVPVDRQGYNTLVRDLPYMSLPQISELMQSMDVELSLPRFTLDYNEDMVPVLKKMKINSLFSNGADLSKIFEGQPAHVDSILHKVYMDVNEKGTVAAAASSAVVVPLINSGVQLKVDRPFVFFIKDNQSGLTLFAGKIEQPNEAVEQNSFSGQQQFQNIKRQRPRPSPLFY